MTVKTKTIYVLLAVFAPPIGCAVMLQDERVPKYIIVMTAVWCAAVLGILMFGGSCRSEAVLQGRQL